MSKKVSRAMRVARRYAEGGEAWEPDDAGEQPVVPDVVYSDAGEQPIPKSAQIYNAVKSLSNARKGDHQAPAPKSSQPSLTAYHPTARERLATSILGDNPSDYRRRLVSEGLGTTGIGETGLGVVDATPLGMGLGAQEGIQHGDYTHAALSIMPGAKATKVAGKSAASLAKKAGLAPVDIYDIPPGAIDHHFKPTAPSQGTQPGGWYTGPDGGEWYVKQHKTLDHAMNEKLAAELYKEAGVPVGDVHLTMLGGKPAVATPKIHGEQLSNWSSKYYPGVEHLHSGFPADAWLANWDVIGAGVENPKGNILVSDKNGAYGAHRIDFGGALRYSGLGKPKEFGPVPNELKTMLDPEINPTAAEVFGQSTVDLHKTGASTVERMANISDERIWDLVNKYGPQSAKEKHTLANNLIQRRDTIVQAWKERVGGGPPSGGKPHVEDDMANWEMPPENDFTDPFHGDYMPDVDGLGNATPPVSNVVSIKPMQINKTKSAEEVVHALKGVNNLSDIVTPKQLSNITTILDDHLPADALIKAMKGLPENEIAPILGMMSNKKKVGEVVGKLYEQRPFNEGAMPSTGRELAEQYNSDPAKIADHLYSLDKAGDADTSNALFSSLPGELKGDVAHHYDAMTFGIKEPPPAKGWDAAPAGPQKADKPTTVEGLGMSPNGHMYGYDPKLDATHLYTTTPYKSIAAQIATWSKKSKDYAQQVYDNLPKGAIKDYVGEELTKTAVSKLPAKVQYGKPLSELSGEFANNKEGWFQYVSQAYNINDLRSFGDQYMKPVDWVNYKPDTMFYEAPKLEAWKKKYLKELRVNPNMTVLHGFRHEIKDPVYAPGDKKRIAYPSKIEDPLKFKGVDEETAFFGADIPSVSTYYAKDPKKVRGFLAKADRAVEIDWYEAFGTHAYSPSRMKLVINAGRLKDLDLIIVKRIEDVDAHAGGSIQTQYLFLNTSGYTAALRSPEAAFNKSLLHLANPVWGIAGGGIIAFQALKSDDANAKEPKMASGGSIENKIKPQLSPFTKPHRLTSAYVRPRLPHPKAFMPKGTGMIHSAIPGRTDKINMRLKSGSYIIPADVVSGLGEGNSTAGGSKLNALFGMGPYGTKTPAIKASAPPKFATAKMSMGKPQDPKFAEGGEAPEQEPHSDIIVAGGEFVVPVEVVRKLGKGNITHGHDILDAMVLNIRKRTINDMKNLKPPKR